MINIRENNKGGRKWNGEKREKKGKGEKVQMINIRESNKLNETGARSLSPCRKKKKERKKTKNRENKNKKIKK